QNVLAEGDIRRGVGQREALLHGENRGMLVNFAGNAKHLQVIEDARFVRHGQNPPFFGVMDGEKRRNQAQNGQFRQNDGGNLPATML
ncbi:hypothetical protein, partial [Escherichia coli]|uniref:hypothetical protein n=1 Tax=Escherichia coli TaxID=562 RepID=UPI0021C92731